MRVGAVRAILICTLLQLGATACDLVPAVETPRAVDEVNNYDRRVIIGDPERGHRIVARLECGICHQIPGIAGAGGIIGPPLAEFAKRQLIAGIVPNQPVALVNFIQDAPSIAPETGMPDMPVSEEEARHIAAFLYTLD